PTIGEVTVMRPGAGMVNEAPMLLQSATTPIDPLAMDRVGGRRSVISGSPPTVSMIHRPAKSGCGSAGLVNSARLPSLAVSISVPSLGRSQLAARSRKAANRRSLPAAAARAVAVAPAHLSV